MLTLYMNVCFVLGWGFCFLFFVDWHKRSYVEDECQEEMSVIAQKEG